MRTIPVVMVLVGLVLVWAGVRNYNPIKVTQNVLQGKEATEDAQLESDSAGGETDPLEQTPENPGPDGEFPLAPGDGIPDDPPAVT